MHDRVGPRLQSRDEFFGRYLGLSEDTGQRAYLDLIMHRHDTAFGTATHHDVASGLTQLFEAEALQGAHDGGARDMRQFRHVPER